MKFGTRLNEIIEARGTSQSALAKHLGIRSQSVTQWANGGTQPRGARLESIAEFLGVSVSDLVAPAGAGIPGVEYERSTEGIKLHSVDLVDPGLWNAKSKAKSSHEKETAFLLEIWPKLDSDTRDALMMLASKTITGAKVG